MVKSPYLVENGVGITNKNQTPTTYDKIDLSCIFKVTLSWPHKTVKC